MNLQKHEIVLGSEPGKLEYNVQGQSYSMDVIFGPTSLNDAKKRRSVWVRNVYGKVMAVPYESAIEFLTERAYKFRPATMEEIPYTPEKKVFPMDSEKKREGQDKANTNLTGREVEELAKNKEEILLSEFSWPQLKKKAAEFGINTYQKTRMVIEEEVKAKMAEKN